MIVMKAGRIELYSWEGALIGQYSYSGISDRNRCINIWKRRYIVGMNRCYFQITPQVDIERLKENGENDMKGPKRKHRRLENNKDLNPLRKADPTKAEIIFFKRGYTGGENTKPRN